MSDSATPAPVSTPTPSTASVVANHPLVYLILLAVLVYGGIVGIESLLAKHDEHVAAAQLQKEGVDTTTQATLLAQLVQDRTADTARDAAQTALIASLVSQMKQQTAATAKQIVTDSTLNAQAAAQRLAAQTKAIPTDVTAVNDTVVLALPVARTVVADEDQLPQEIADVTNLQSQLGAQQILTSDAKSEAAAAQTVIAADKTELFATLKADNAACDVRVDAQAKKDRKRGFWATVGGVVVGVLLGSRL